MKKIAYALSIGLMISLLGCGYTQTTNQTSAPVATEKVTAPAPEATTPPVVAPAVSPGSWVITNTWSADGDKTTEAFAITGESTRIDRETAPGVFQVDVQNSKGETLTTFSNRSGDIGKKTTFLEGLAPGQYTFKVKSASPWKIAIQQQQK